MTIRRISPVLQVGFSNPAKDNQQNHHVRLPSPLHPSTTNIVEPLNDFFANCILLFCPSIFFLYTFRYILLIVT